MKKGYTQTEIGIIPEDWEVKSYGDIFDFFNTATYSREQLTRNSNIFYIHYGDIHTKYNHFIDFDNAELPSITEEQSKGYSFIKEGDLIVVDASEDYEGASKSVEVKNLKNRKAISGLHTFLLREKSSTFVNGFKAYIFYNHFVKKQIDTLATGTKVYGVSRSNLKTILIPYPPTKAEQAAIAEALSDIDSLITEQEKLIAKKKAVKQGAMQELFKPKEGWVEKRLGNCLLQNPDYGINAAAVPFNEDLPIYLRITDITDDGKFSRKNISSINNKLSTEYYLQEEDLVYARTGASVGKTYLYNSRDGKLVFAGFLIRIRVDKNILLSDYFKYYTQTVFYKNWIASNSQRTGQPGINGNEYKELPVFLPSTKEQQITTAHILSDMDTEIEHLEKKLSKYRMIKQGMMNDLLTGKVRLPHIVTKQNNSEMMLFGEEKPEHSRQFDDAVAIAAIVYYFSSNEKYPLGRKKIQKLLYLFRRKQHVSVSNFKEKAAGPYDSDIRYNGGENIAISSKYITKEESNRGSRFRAGKEWQKVEGYINKWNWGKDVYWLRQTFEYKAVDYLEVLATVDNAMIKLKDDNVDITWQNVKKYIQNSLEWKDKLKRECFSDLSIQEAIRDSLKLFCDGAVQ